MAYDKYFESKLVQKQKEKESFDRFQKVVKAATGAIGLVVTIYSLIQLFPFISAEGFTANFNDQISIILISIIVDCIPLTLAAWALKRAFEKSSVSVGILVFGLVLPISFAFNVIFYYFAHQVFLSGELASLNFFDFINRHIIPLPWFAFILYISVGGLLIYIVLRNSPNVKTPYRNLILSFLKAINDFAVLISILTFLTLVNSSGSNIINLFLHAWGLVGGLGWILPVITFGGFWLWEAIVINYQTLTQLYEPEAIKQWKQQQIRKT